MKRIHGFTLVEIMLVIVILGILSSAAVSRFWNFRTRADYGQVLVLLDTVKRAAFTCHNIKGAWEQCDAISKLDMDMTVPSNWNVCVDQCTTAGGACVFSVFRETPQLFAIMRLYDNGDIRYYGDGAFKNMVGNSNWAADLYPTTGACIP